MLEDTTEVTSSIDSDSAIARKLGQMIMSPGRSGTQCPC